MHMRSKLRTAYCPLPSLGMARWISASSCLLVFAMALLSDQVSFSCDRSKVTIPLLPLPTSRVYT
jgi:hypothetical protein